MIVNSKSSQLDAVSPWMGDLIRTTTEGFDFYSSFPSFLSFFFFFFFFFFWRFHCIHKKVAILHKEEGILHKDEGILHKEEEIVHKDEGVLQKKEVIEYFAGRRELNPSQGGGRESFTRRREFP